MPRASGARAGTHRSTISARRKMDPGSRDARPGNVDSCALIHARKSQRILHPSPAWRLFGSRPTPSNAEDAERTRRRNEAVTPSLFSLVRKKEARAPMKLVLHRTSTGNGSQALRRGRESQRCDDRYLRKEPHRSCLKLALQSRLLKRMATRGALERFKFPPVVKTLRARARFGKPKRIPKELTPKRALLSMIPATRERVRSNTCA